MEKEYGADFRIGDLVRCVSNRGNKLLENDHIYCIRERSFYHGAWFVKLEGEGLISRITFFATRFVKAGPIPTVEEML